MTISDDIEDYVAAALRSTGGLITAAGTVATSPSQVSTDPLTVVLDGSAYAVPVKQFRAFPIFPGMRVGLILIGTEWVVIGSFSNPAAGSSMRMALGADTPPELQAFGIGVAMLMYDTDKTSGLEVGYFFIGISNVLDGSADEKVMLFGKVKYPIAGNPASPTMSDVKTAHQINLNGSTWFKDFPVLIQTSVPSFTVKPQSTFDGNVIVNGVSFFNANAFFSAGDQVQFSGATFLMSGSQFSMQPGSAFFSDVDLSVKGKNVLRGETHTQLVTFGSPTPVTSHTIVVAYDFVYATVPNVICQIVSGAGATAQWHVRPINIGTGTFTIFLFTAGTAGAWTNQGVQWTAIATN